MAKALYSATDGSEPAKDDLRLQSITQRLMRKSGEDFSDFGNSGNDAYVSITTLASECSADTTRKRSTIWSCS